MTQGTQACPQSHRLIRCPILYGSDELVAEGTALGMNATGWYKHRRQVKRAESYNKFVGELPEMRREAVELMRNAVTQNRRANVLVNNRLEGNAPLTVQALTDQLSQ